MDKPRPRSGEAHAAADLFAEDGTYQVTPFVEPMRGPHHSDYWTHVLNRRGHFSLGYEILSANPRAGIAHAGGLRFSLIPPPASNQARWVASSSSPLPKIVAAISLREVWHNTARLIALLSRLVGILILMHLCPTL